MVAPPVDPARRPSIIAIGAVALTVVGALVLGLALRGCGPDPVARRTPLAVADSALAAEGSRATAERGEALTAADSFATIALSLSAETSRRLAVLSARNAALRSQLDALRDELASLPPDSLAARAAALCRARRADC